MLNLLLIEDSSEDSSLFQDTVSRLNIDADEEKYHLEIADSYSDGMNKVSGRFNGIIVDIKLDGGHSGRDIICEIINKYRVPVVIFTGTPYFEEQNDDYPIKIYKKGEASQEDIIKELCAVSDTGLFKVLGGTGILEKTMTQIFWNNLYPHIELWKDMHSKGIDTETILLRYAISHIQELIDSDGPAYVTEEMYISPTIDEKIKTGSIIKSKNEDKYYIVLSPPCDLALHGEKFKTNYVLICEIDPLDEVNSKIINGLSKSKHNKKIKEAIKNNYTDYYHWLPKNTLFVGGYINFRKVNTYSPEKLDDLFNAPSIKVQDVFVKSILNRFSSYYSRQGQPDFDFEKEAGNIVNSLSNNI